MSSSIHTPPARSQRMVAIRASRREKGLAEVNVWIPKELVTQADETVHAGRFKNRSEVVNEALRALLKDKPRM